MSVAPAPALWTVGDGDCRIHLFAGRALLAAPWLGPKIERALASSEEFWNETPQAGPEMQALALQHGIDPEQPLAGWLTPEDRVRLDSAASAAGMATAILAPLRPWLAAQFLTLAAASRRGLDPESSPEALLQAHAERQGLRMRHEFATPEALVRVLSELPRAAEVEFLRVALDDALAPPERDRKRALAWLAGDLELEDSLASEIARRHPAF
jgi:uncharacterized protein YbaP (TraB family)